MSLAAGQPASRLGSGTCVANAQRSHLTDGPIDCCPHANLRQPAAQQRLLGSIAASYLQPWLLNRAKLCRRAAATQPSSIVPRGVPYSKTSTMEGQQQPECSCGDTTASNNAFLTSVLGTTRGVVCLAHLNSRAQAAHPATPKRPGRHDVTPPQASNFRGGPCRSSEWLQNEAAQDVVRG